MHIGPGLRGWTVCLKTITILSPPPPMICFGCEFLLLLGEPGGKIISEEFGSLCSSYLMFNCVCKCSVTISPILV